MIQNDNSSSEGAPFLSQTERTALIIRSLRNLFGMSQGELAKAAGVSRPTISRLEKLEAGSSIRTATLDSLVRVFSDKGVEVHFLHNDVRIELAESCLVSAANAIRKHR